MASSNVRWYGRAKMRSRIHWKNAISNHKTEVMLTCYRTSWDRRTSAKVLQRPCCPDKQTVSRAECEICKGITNGTISDIVNRCCQLINEVWRNPYSWQARYAPTPSQITKFESYRQVRHALSTEDVQRTLKNSRRTSSRSSSFSQQRNRIDSSDDYFVRNADFRRITSQRVSTAWRIS